MECKGSLLPVSRGDLREGRNLWTAIASAEGASGPSRKSLTGLGVETLRDEVTSPWTRSVAQIGHGLQKI